jgi:Zn-dependent protease
MEATLTEKLSLFLVLIASLSVHEWAHAATADKMGDPTPRLQGRLTLNPLAHIDLFGTVILPLLMILLPGGFMILGWGRPVMIDPRNFKKPVTGDILTSLAGPFSNLVLALIIAVIFGVWLGYVHDGAAGQKILLLGSSIIMLNAVLAAFNLLPVPPLDGSHLMRHLFHISELNYMRFAQWGTLILIVLINIPFFQTLLYELVQLVSTPFIYVMGMIAEKLAGV